MSVPYGAPQPASRPPNSPDRPGPDLTFILTLVAAGAGLVGYVLGFFGVEASSVINGMAGFSLVAAAALAALRILPKAPNTLYAAAPLAAYAALNLLQKIVGGSAGGVAVVLLLLAIVQVAAVVVVLLVEAGIVSLQSGGTEPPLLPRSGPLPAPSQPPPRPQQQGHPGQPPFGQQPGGPPPQPQWGAPGAAHTGPQPHSGPTPGGQPQSPQQGGRNPASSGQPAQSGQLPTPPAQGQGGQQASEGQSSGPQGTQQMRHPAQSPGAPPPGF